MTVRAVVQYDWMRLGVAVALVDHGEAWRSVRVWETNPPRVAYDPASPEEPTIPDGYESKLVLSEDEARALYESLGEFFGHAGTSTQALRKDYDAERDRVDRLTGALVDIAVGRRARATTLDEVVRRRDR